MLDPDPSAPSASPVRRQWLTPDLALDAVLAFEERYGPQHALLAAHAAFPLVVTPELLNLIRINFLEAERVAWIAEADFLLSSLCTPLGDDLYAVDPAVREVLLVDLVDRVEDGRRRLERLADFLLAYLDRRAGPGYRPDVARAQRWIAWSVLDPQRVVDDMTRLLQEQAASEAPGFAALARQVQVATMVEVVRGPLAAGLRPEAYRELVQAAQVLAQYWYGGPEAAGPEPAPGVVSPGAARALQTALGSPGDPASPLLEAIRRGIRQTTGRPEPAPARLHTLPAPPPDDGRNAAALERLLQAVDEGYAALVVHGPAGAGKTALLLRLAHRLAGSPSGPEATGGALAPRYPDAQLFLSLDGARPASAALEEVVRAFDPNAALPPSRALLRRQYLDVLTGKRVLLLADDAASAEQVEPLLPPPGSLLLVSARVPIHLPGGWTLELDARPEPPEPPEPWADRAEFLEVRNALVPSGPIAVTGPIVRVGGVALRRRGWHGPETIVIGGAAGTGKTALAARLAWDPEVRSRFSGRVLWVGLTPETDLLRELDRLAAALGVATNAAADPLERASAIARAASGRSYLLVVDDVRDARLVEVFRALGAEALIVTTRRPEIVRRADQVVTLGPLAREQAAALLDRLVPAARGDPEVLRLAAFTDGLPLALVLLGRWTEEQLRAGRTPEQLEQHFSRVSVRAIGDDPGRFWHWLLLEGGLRTGYVELGAFAEQPADFDVAAVRHVWEPISEELTRAWLARLHQEGLLAAGARAGRYALTPEQAAFARQQVGPSHPFQRTHATYYATLVGRDPENDDLIATELGQIEHAVRHLPEGAPEVAPLAAALARHFRLQGAWEEVRVWAERGLRAARAAKLRAEEGRLLGLLAEACSRLGQPDRALRAAREALEIAAELDDDRAVAELQRLTVDLLGRPGRLRGVSRSPQERPGVPLREALASARAIRAPRLRAETLYELAARSAARERTRLLHEALAAFQAALASGLEVTGPLARAALLAGVAGSHRALGARPRALESAARAAEILREAAGAPADAAELARALDRVGDLFWTLDEIWAALDLYALARDVRQRAGDRAGELLWLLDQSAVDALAGNPERRGERYAREALGRLRAAGDHERLAIVAAGLAMWLVAEGHADRAGRLLHDALSEDAAGPEAAVATLKPALGRAEQARETGHELPRPLREAALGFVQQLPFVELPAVRAALWIELPISLGPTGSLPWDVVALVHSAAAHGPDHLARLLQRALRFVEGGLLRRQGQAVLAELAGPGGPSRDLPPA